MCHRLFFRKLSQNPEYIQTHCNDLNYLFHFACRKWYLGNPQYVHFRCGLLHIKDSLKDIGKRYKLQESLLEQVLEHDEIYEENWEEKENEWLPYLKNDVLSTAFSYARSSKGMEELTGFVMKNRLTLTSLANKYVNSFRDENDEPIHTYNVEFMRHF